MSDVDKAEIARLDGQLTKARVMLDAARGIIANAHGGRWNEAAHEWRSAAERWRDELLTSVVAPTSAIGWPDAVGGAALLMLGMLAFVNDECDRETVEHLVADYLDAHPTALETWLDIMKRHPQPPAKAR